MRWRIGVSHQLLFTCEIPFSPLQGLRAAMRTRKEDSAIALDVIFIFFYIVSFIIHWRAWRAARHDQPSGSQERPSSCCQGICERVSNCYKGCVARLPRWCDPSLILPFVGPVISVYGFIINNFASSGVLLFLSIACLLLGGIEYKLAEQDISTNIRTQQEENAKRQKEIIKQQQQINDEYKLHIAHDIAVLARNHASKSHTEMRNILKLGEYDSFEQIRNLCPCYVKAMFNDVDLTKAPDIPGAQNPPPRQEYQPSGDIRGDVPIFTDTGQTVGSGDDQENSDTTGHNEQMHQQSNYTTLDSIDVLQELRRNVIQLARQPAPKAAG